MNEIKVTFDSKKENISILRNMLGAIIIDKNPTISFINELKTVLSEAITNAIVHGYEGRDNEIVEVIFSRDEGGIWIEVIDSGIGIDDVEQAREPLFSTKKDEERSGLGFTIMDLFSDEFIVESEKNKGTRIKMYKKW